MARGKEFTKEEIETIKVLLEAGKTLYRIARLIDRPFQSLYLLEKKGRL